MGHRALTDRTWISVADNASMPLTRVSSNDPSETWASTPECSPAEIVHQDPWLPAWVKSLQLTTGGKGTAQKRHFHHSVLAARSWQTRLETGLG